MLEQSSKGAIEMSAQRKPSKKDGVHLLGCNVFIKSETPYGTMSPVGRIHEFGDQGVEAAVAPLTITPSDPLGILYFLSCNSGLYLVESPGPTLGRGHSEPPIEL